MEALDFLLGDDGDLIWDGVDFEWGESDAQHIQHLCELEPGELKELPLVGIGLSRAINGVVDGVLRRRIKLQLEADGYEVAPLDNIENGVIDAYRKG